jgi:hypothetical protein
MHPYPPAAPVTARMPPASAVPPMPPPPPPRPPGDAGWHEQFPRRSFIELAADPAAVPSARLRLRADLRQWKLGIPADDAELVTDEIVANAVNATRAAGWQGPRPPVRLWAVGGTGTLFVLVWDATASPPQPGDPGEDAVSGRGLRIVAALSHWGYYYPPGDQAGKVVWAQFPKPAGHEAAHPA